MQIRPSYLYYYFADKAVVSKTVNTMANPNTYLVIEDYVHAMTSRFPRARYMPGNYTKYLLWIFWNLPEWISDWTLSLMAPKPAGVTQTWLWRELLFCRDTILTAIIVQTCVRAFVRACKCVCVNKHFKTVITIMLLLKYTIKFRRK